MKVVNSWVEEYTRVAEVVYGSAAQSQTYIQTVLSLG